MALSATLSFFSAQLFFEYTQFAGIDHSELDKGDVHTGDGYASTVDATTQ